MPLDPITSISDAIAKIAQLGTQVSANRGEKIPLTKYEIKADSERRTRRKDKREAIQEAINDFEIHAEHFGLISRGKARNQIRNIIKSGKDITSVDPATFEGRWCVYIRYVYKEDGQLCQNWDRIIGKKV